MSSKNDYLNQIENKLIKAVEALEFYANEDNWQYGVCLFEVQQTDGFWQGDPDYVEDTGQYAAEVLKELKGE